jgi:hypothetical protein
MHAVSHRMAGANQPCDQWLGLTGLILIGFERAGCESLVTEAEKVRHAAGQ